MRLQDIMTTDVETIDANETADFAWDKMRFHQIHHLVVVDERETVIGVLSEHDLGGKHGESIRYNKRVADLMTSDPVVASPRTTLKQAANEFRGATIGCIPVVENGELVGIVTITDLLEVIGIGVRREHRDKEKKPKEPHHAIYRRAGHAPRK